MPVKSLGNPFDPSTSLSHETGCSCQQCTSTTTEQQASLPSNSEDIMDRAIENAVVRAVFNQNDYNRRQFMGLLGGGSVAAMLSTGVLKLLAARPSSTVTASAECLSP